MERHALTLLEPVELREVGVTMARNDAGPTAPRCSAPIQMARRESEVASRGPRENDVFGPVGKDEPCHGPGIGPWPRLVLDTARQGPLPRTVEQHLGEAGLGVDPPSAQSLRDPGCQQQGRKHRQQTFQNHSMPRSWRIARPKTMARRAVNR